MSRVTIIDSTGANARCNKCHTIVGEAAVAYANLWWCSACAAIARSHANSQREILQESKRKMKKRGRTLKAFIVERLQEEPLPVTQLAREAMENELTTASDLKAAKISVSATISQLRKNGYPIERVSRGVYSWHTS